jgi:uncharacterized protein
MKSVFAAVCLLVILAGTAAAQSQAEFNRSKYIKSVRTERQEKDKEMRTDSLSPIPAEKRAGFPGLTYFRPKTAFRKEAAFTRYDQMTHFFMKTTTSRMPEYAVYGEVSFRHQGKKYTLNVYQNIELSKKPEYRDYLFIPFNDLTNGAETYGGGRFLDITETGADTLILDFNKAYNPYCAYNHKYSCPVPPEENNLDLHIRAGEKKYHHD